MSSKLDHLASTARSSSLAWTAARADGVLATTLARRDRRRQRERVVRRGVIGLGGVVTMFVLLLRGAGATPAASLASDPTVTPAAPALLAESHASDGGYVHD